MKLQKHISLLLLSVGLVAPRAMSSTPEGLKPCDPAQVHQFYQSLAYSPEYRALHQKRLERVADYQAGREAPDLAKYISAEEVPDFQTIRLFHKIGGRIHPQSDVRMLLIHGNGSSRSHSKAMALMLRHFSDPGAATAGGTLKKMSEMPGYVKISAEAIDLPGHGVGPLLSNFSEPAKTTEWLTRYEKQMKAETPNLPFVVMTRSGSGPIASRTLEKNADLVDAFVLMSPVYPGDQKMLDHGVELLLEDARINQFTVDMPLINWAKKNSAETHWTPEYFKGKPVLIMTGSEDTQMTEIERSIYRKFAEQSPNIHYVDIKGAGHDVLRTSGAFKEPGMKAYEELYQFLGTRVVRKH